jgi:mannitol-specific phosphotransferase system IIBC component
MRKVVRLAVLALVLIASTAAAVSVLVVLKILVDLMFAPKAGALAAALGFVALISVTLIMTMLMAKEAEAVSLLSESQAKYEKAKAESEDAFRKYLKVFRERGESEARAEAKEADRKWKEARKWGVALYKLKKRTWARYETT